jgi:DNA-binding response OmpR family regulator/4-amino-4-deoxy-L-arabinose transferase-like glycosyltransferase
VAGPRRPAAGPAAIGALALITLAAGVLRLSSLGRVPLDPFYDAAVRSMAQSLHNFFFGVYEPGGSVAIDKPPIDLWLQVVSVKLFGFGSVALKLPQALAGTLAVPVLYDAVRRIFGQLAGLASALVLAVLPIAVLTARSDTMDAVMMLLSVLALWLLVRYALERRPRHLYLAAGAIGVAFNVKLFQGLVCVPGLLLLAVLASREGRWRRLAVTVVVFAAVALSWLTATSIVGGEPFAIGSTNGSAWNAAFVFNGYDRIAKPASQADLSGGADSGPRRRPAGNSEVQRAAVPIGTPAPLRLFDHDGPLSGLRLGYVLLTALLLGAPALVLSILRPPGGTPERAVAAGLLLWLATGLVLFSVMARLHPRYTEGFTPAVAAAGGIGLAWAIRGSLAGRALAAVCALGLAAYGHYLLGGSSTVWRITGLAAAAGLAAGPRARGCARRRGPAPPRQHRRRPRSPRRVGRRPGGDDAPGTGRGAQRLPASPPPGRALRGRRRRSHPGRVADRPGRGAGARPDVLRRPTARLGPAPGRARGRRIGRLRPPRGRLRTPDVAQARRLLERGVLDPRPRPRRLPGGRARSAEAPLAPARRRLTPAPAGSCRSRRALRASVTAMQQRAAPTLEILVVDDEAPLREMLTRSFTREGHRVTAVSDGTQAIERASAGDFSIVLLDVALGPGPNGHDVCRTLRARRNVVPIIMLTALDSEADAVQGLEAGADDYVTKPFGLAELRSRIRAVLRRAGPGGLGGLGEEVLTVGPVRLDRAQREVTVAGRPARLTFSEFELLSCLMSEPQRLFNRQELLRAIWGDSAYRDPRAIDVHIRHLREKLEERPDEPRLILTVRGAGYRFAEA